MILTINNVIYDNVRMREQIDLLSKDVEIGVIALRMCYKLKVYEPEYPAYKDFKTDESYFEKGKRDIVSVKPISFAQNNGLGTVVFNYVVLKNKSGVPFFTKKVSIKRIEINEKVLIEVGGIVLHVIEQNYYK